MLELYTLRWKLEIDCELELSLFGQLFYIIPFGIHTILMSISNMQQSAIKSEN